MTHGEIWTIDFGVPVGSLPSKIRPGEGSIQLPVAFNSCHYTPVGV